MIELKTKWGGEFRYLKSFFVDFLSIWREDFLMERDVSYVLEIGCYEIGISVIRRFCLGKWVEVIVIVIVVV